MTLNTEREGKEKLRRRASTPIPSSHQPGPRDRRLPAEPRHPPLGQSASYQAGDKSVHPRASWSSDSDESDSSGAECLYRVVLLGDHGVGKSSLASIFAGIQEKDAHHHIGGGLFLKIGIVYDCKCSLNCICSPFAPCSETLNISDC